MTAPLVLSAGLIAAGCVVLAALCRHSRSRLRRIEALNKGLERNAAAQGDQLHAIYAAVPVGTWSHDLTSNRVVLQGRINEVYGFSANRTDLSFEELLQSIHPEDRGKILEAPLVARGAASSLDIEFRVVQPGGSIHWILSVGGVSRYADGKPACLGGINLDITRRKNAEIALRESEAQVRQLNQTLEERVRLRTAELLDSERSFHRMVEGVQDYAIFMLDTNGRVVSWNLGAERIFGYTAEDIVGKHISILSPEENIQRGDPQAELRMAAIDGRITKEAWRVRRDGSRFWANVVITAVSDDSGGLCGFSKVTRDCSERQRAQEKLQEQRTRAEHANQAKSGFLAAMSHEIRTPMNAILGMSDLLWDTELNEDQRHYVEIFRSAGADLLDLINNILDLSKIEAGRLELENAAFDLESVVTDVMQLFGPKARDKGLLLRANLEPGVTRVLIGDAARLRQILVNLVGNALEFTNAGEVAVFARNREGGRPGELSFTVSDTGVGIPAQNLKTIFDAFTQVDSSIARKHGGSGLGLAICRRLVESMGGSLRVESEPGRGSAFHFTARFEVDGSAVGRLDAAGSRRAAHRENGTVVAPVVRTAARTILVAEDSLDNQFVIQAYLRHRPYALVFVADGLAALKQCSEKEFDAVLMDVQMPVMDGLAAARAIREMEREQGRRPVPILALTANVGHEDVEASRLAGCTTHLSKPISKVTFVLAVEDLLAANEPAPPRAQSPVQRSNEVLVAPPEGLESLAPRYLSARRQEVQEMEALLAASDFERISSRGHNLKGTGRSYGFPDLTEIGAALERSAKHQDKDGIHQQLLRLAKYLESVRMPAEIAQH